MKAVLNDVAAKIARHRGTNIGEQNTKLTLINPVLRPLGWDVEDLEDVQHEYRRRPHDKPVDYALLLLRTPRLFIEAKALDGDLHDPRWANQIISYATVAGVEWVVLTNGDEYRIYNAHALVPAEEKLFRTVKVSESLDATADALALLTKEQIQRNSLGALWNAHQVDSKVKTALEALFRPEPSPWLVRRLTRSLEGLTQGDVRAALSRGKLTLDFPAEKPPPPRPLPAARTPDAVPDQSHRRVETPTADPRTKPEVVAKVSVADLIASALIKPPLELTRRYKGIKLTARIEADGRVSCLGATHSSLSTAAGMARRSVVGAPPGRKYPQTNGWTFWQFRDADGKPQELSILRERFAKREPIAENERRV